ncbi:MAG: tetratricopeptide repeat protein [Gemmataceae bacterium]|nr:tetratricopeptide repeat protein [Gemmataceae bacterium]
MIRTPLCVLAMVAMAWPLHAQEAEVSFRDKALALNNVTGDEAILGKVKELRKDKDSLKKLLADAKSLAKEKGKDQPFSYNGAYILARSAHSIRDYEGGEFFYKICLEHAFKLRSTQKLAQVFDSLIDLFDRAKKYDDALFTCEKFLSLKGADDDDKIESVKPFVIEKMIMIQCQKKEFDKALAMTQKMIDADKGGWYFQHRRAEVLREAGKFEESAREFEAVLEKIKANERLTNDDKDRFAGQCNYLLSSVYLDLGQFDKSVKLLEDLVAQNPKNPGFANDLGYILADHDKRMDEAQKLVEKALAMDSDARKKLVEEGQLSQDELTENAAYLDSLAWIYFKKKEYPKALELMKKVVKDEDSQHVEIYDHYAEILKANGKKSEAVEAWKKALTLEELGHRDIARKEAIRKKLKDNE